MTKRLQASFVHLSQHKQSKYFHRKFCHSSAPVYHEDFGEGDYCAPPPLSVFNSSSWALFPPPPPPICIEGYVRNECLLQQSYMRNPEFILELGNLLGLSFVFSCGEESLFYSSSQIFIPSYTISNSTSNQAQRSFIIVHVTFVAPVTAL